MQEKSNFFNNSKNVHFSVEDNSWSCVHCTLNNYVILVYVHALKCSMLLPFSTFLHIQAYKNFRYVSILKR